MDLAGLLLRAIDNRGYVYLPYHLEGDFTQEERQIVENAINPHVPKKVDAMFNNWRIAKYSTGYFYAVRATWEDGFFAHSAKEIADKITEYYNDNWPLNTSKD